MFQLFYLYVFWAGVIVQIMRLLVKQFAMAAKILLDHQLVKD